jgi:hypothetical protein
VSEWLRREIRNLLGSPAQVRILSTSVSFLVFCTRNIIFLFAMVSLNFLSREICGDKTQSMGWDKMDMVRRGE